MSKVSKGFLKKAGVVALAVVMGLGVLACTSGCQKKSEAPQYDDVIDVRVGYWGGTCESAMYVAYEKGFFEEYGINAEMFNITASGAGAGAMVQDATDNGIYAIFNATPNFLPAMEQGMDVKYIAEVHTGCIQACATADSGITDVAGLEGQKVGTFDTHDMGEIFLRAAMVNAGADPDSVEFITEGNIATMLQAAANGEIVAFANFDPYVEICTQFFGYTKIFNNATDDGFKDQCCCFLAANQPVYSDTEISSRIAGAINAACEWITDNPEEAAKIIQGENESGTAYVTPTEQLLSAFGVDPSLATGNDFHQALIESYTWGNTSEEHFMNSLKEQWETIQKAGMLTSDKSIDELVELCAAYCGL